MVIGWQNSLYGSQAFLPKIRAVFQTSLIKIAFTKANGTYDRNFNPGFSLTWWSRDH